MESNLRPIVSSTCQFPHAHILNIAWIAQQRSLYSLSYMHDKRLDVRVASSSVPWRNAQPTSPSPAPSSEVDVPQSNSILNNTSTSTTQQPQQQPKVRDLVGYTAVLSIKAVKKQEDRVLGIVTEVIGASETGLGHPLLKVVSQSSSPTFYSTPATTTTASPPLPAFHIEHLIPLVRNIVPRIDPGAKRLLVDPPSGLLDLGKRRAMLQHLKIELTEFIKERRKTSSINSSRNSSSCGDNTEDSSLSNENEVNEKLPTSRSDNSSSGNSSGSGNDSGDFGSTILNMPLRRELESAGRKDLVKLIQSAGGFIEVAQDLGFRPVRRPPGYWEDEEALDRELSLFVSANWVRFEEDSDTEELESAVFSDPQGHALSLQEEEDRDQEKRNQENQEVEGKMLLKTRKNTLQTVENEGNEKNSEKNDEKNGVIISNFQKKSQQKESLLELESIGNEVYWYNQVTRKVRWSAPVLPQTLALDDQGSTLLTDSPDDRAMPSRSALFAAGRYDLHQAIVAAGGYTQVSEDLDRYPAWPPSRHLRSFRTLAAELKEFVEETGLPKSKMPTRGELLSMGRSDLHQAVTKLGGYPTVARRLRWKSQRKKRGEWKNIEATAAELKKFALENNNSGGDRDGNVLRMPTHEELRAAGRHDLRHALQQHGSGEVARLAGLEVRRRTGLGAGKRRQRRLDEMADEHVQNDNSAAGVVAVAGEADDV